MTRLTVDDAIVKSAVAVLRRARECLLAFDPYAYWTEHLEQAAFPTHHGYSHPTSGSAMHLAHVPPGVEGEVWATRTWNFVEATLCRYGISRVEGTLGRPDSPEAVHVLYNLLQDGWLIDRVALRLPLIRRHMDGIFKGV